MRILDKDNNEITSPDLEKGYLKNETIVIKHHEAVEAKQGKSHIEIIKEYINGGKDIITMWDEKPVEGRDAYDETEEIQRYYEYTEDEIKQRKKQQEEDSKIEKEKQDKLNSLYNSEMTFNDLVDAVAEIMFGSNK